MTIQKLSFLVGWSALILMELLAAFGLAWITVNPADRVENSPTVWFCIALPVALVLHLTLTRFVEAMRIRNAAIQTGLNKVWVTISGVAEFMNLLKSLAIAIIAAAAAVWLSGHVHRQWARGELQVSTPTFAYAGGFLTYGCVVVPLYYCLRGKLSFGSFGAAFRCTVAGDKLIFALGNRTFEVAIHEIIELKVLADYGEGSAFFERNIAANVPLIAQNPIETTKWIAGKTSRPKVFFQSPSTGLASVYLRTSQVFLFAPLKAESVEVLSALEHRCDVAGERGLGVVG